MTPAERLDHCEAALNKLMEDMSGLGLDFSIELLRIVDIELQKKIHDVPDGKIDVVAFAANLVARERHKRQSFKKPHS